jgi:Chaperone of endosialidase
MDDTRFDAWTRRRVGVALGGASLLGLTQLRPAAAKKHKPKIRCRKELQTCDPTDKTQQCCSGLNCDVFGVQVGLHCCLGLRARYDQGAIHCCGEQLCEVVDGLSGTRCCADLGNRCSENADCCAGTVCGQGRCAALSDRTRKANVGSVDPADMLIRVRDLPISTWNYTSDDASVRHIGPMAQDFVALFGVGADDRHIHPLDGQGVALAAIQALAREIDRLHNENTRLAARLEALETESGVGSTTLTASARGWCCLPWPEPLEPGALQGLHLP